MKKLLRVGLLGVAFLLAVLVIGTIFLVPISADPSVPRPLQRVAQRVAREIQCHKPGPRDPRCPDLVEMEVRDVIPLREASTHAVVLVTKDRAVVLPIFVDEEAALAIAFRLAHREPPKPISHDLPERLIGELGGTVTEVRIDDVEDHLYEGRLLITQGDKKLEVPARPSDSIAMALGGGVKIFATRKVLDAAGITREEIDELRAQAHPPGAAPSPGPGVGGSGPPHGLPGDEPAPLPPRHPPVPGGQGPEINL